MIIHLQITEVHPSVSKAFVGQKIVLMMKVIFKDLTQLIFKKFYWKFYTAGPSTSLVMENWPYFQWSGLNFKKNFPRDLFKLVFWVGDIYGNISLIRLYVVQLFNNFLTAV